MAEVIDLTQLDDDAQPPPRQRRARDAREPPPPRQKKKRARDEGSDNDVEITHVEKRERKATTGISTDDAAAAKQRETERLEKTPAMRRGLQSLSQDAKTPMDHRAKLSIYSAPSQQRFSSVVCTIGPKTKDVEKLTMLREAGLNVARMNFSHGSYEYHGSVIENTRKSVQEKPLGGRLVAIALDTKGPEIRTGMLKGEADVALAKGANIVVTTDAALKDQCNGETLYMDYANLPKVMSVGGIIFVDDGLIGLKVVSIDAAAGTLTCEVLNNGMLGSRNYSAVRLSEGRHWKGNLYQTTTKELHTGHANSDVPHVFSKGPAPTFENMDHALKHKSTYLGFCAL